MATTRSESRNAQRRSSGICSLGGVAIHWALKSPAKPDRATHLAAANADYTGPSNAPLSNVSLQLHSGGLAHAFRRSGRRLLHENLPSLRFPARHSFPSSTPPPDLPCWPRASRSLTRRSAAAAATPAPHPTTLASTRAFFIYRQDHRHSLGMGPLRHLEAHLRSICSRTVTPPRGE
jgi:hypothetical protein